MASVVVAGALAVVVSAYSLKDQSAVLPTKVVKASESKKESPVAEENPESATEEYVATKQTAQKTVNVASPVTETPMPVAPEVVTPAEPVSSPTPTPEPTPEPTPDPSPEPEA